MEITFSVDPQEDPAVKVPNVDSMFEESTIGR